MACSSQKPGCKAQCKAQVSCSNGTDQCVQQLEHSNDWNDLSRDDKDRINAGYNDCRKNDENDVYRGPAPGECDGTGGPCEKANRMTTTDVGICGNDAHAENCSGRLMCLTTQINTQCGSCEETCMRTCQGSCLVNRAGQTRECADACESHCQTACESSSQCGSCMSCQGCQSTCEKSVQCTPLNQRPRDWKWKNCVVAGEEIAGDTKVIKERKEINDNIFEAFGEVVSNGYHMRLTGEYITASEWNDFTDRINAFERYKNHSNHVTSFAKMKSDTKGAMMDIKEIKKAYETIMKMTNGFPERFDTEYCRPSNKVVFPNQPNKEFDMPKSQKEILGFTFQDLQILLNNIK